MEHRRRALVDADATRTFADGLDGVEWPADVAELIPRMQAGLRTEASEYDRIAAATDFRSYEVALSQKTSANRPSAQIRLLLGLPPTVDNGRYGCVTG